jgi:predicted GNAT family acetyltransferase
MTATETPCLLADPTLGEEILDNAAWASLTGPHRRFSERRGGAARYLPAVAPFVALADQQDPQSWLDAAELVGPGGTFAIAGSDVRPPPGWTSVGGIEGVQLVDVDLVKERDAEAVRLTAEDVPEMLELVARTQPGPFFPRTIELGTYLGIRRGGVLIAMAGERLHPHGWTEISAVCTDSAFRGQGLATRLVSAVGAGIAERGDRVLLHAAAHNRNAIGLYVSIGFRLRRRTRFHLVTVPQGGEVCCAS